MVQSRGKEDQGREKRGDEGDPGVEVEDMATDVLFLWREGIGGVRPEHGESRRQAQEARPELPSQMLRRVQSTKRLRGNP